MVIKKLSYRSKNPNFSLEKDLQGKWVVSNLVLKGEKRWEDKKKKKYIYIYIKKKKCYLFIVFDIIGIGIGIWGRLED